jgi:hypothetical protein
MPIIKEYIDFNNDTYQNTSVGTQVSNGWTVLQNTDPNIITNGFYGRAYAKGNEIVITFRGSQKEDFVNDILIADGQIARAQVPDQLRSANVFYQTVKNSAAAVGKTVYVTGNSSGGTYAQVIGAQYGVNAVTLNAAGSKDMVANINASENLLTPNNTKFSINPNSTYSNIQNYVTETDVVRAHPVSF